MGSLTLRLPLSISIPLAIAALSSALGTVSCGHGSPSTEPPAERAGDGPPLQKGTLQRWPEGTQYLLVDVSHDPATAALGQPKPTGLDALWSIASTENGGSGFFYSDAVHGADDTQIAYAVDVQSVRDIHDASRYDFSTRSVGPVPVGAIVLVHYLPTDRYLALVLDAVAPTDARTAGAGPYAYADVTWYLTGQGQADFSAAF